MTPHVFGEILYENFIFDIPKIFDLCVLYGEGNAQLLTKMVDNIFTQQPKYNDDLLYAVPTIIQVQLHVHVLLPTIKPVYCRFTRFQMY